MLCGISWLAEASGGALGCSDASYVLGDRSGSVRLVAQALRRGELWLHSSVRPIRPLLMYTHASGLWRITGIAVETPLDTMLYKRSTTRRSLQVVGFRKIPFLTSDIRNRIFLNPRKSMGFIAAGTSKVSLSITSIPPTS